MSMFKELVNTSFLTKKNIMVIAVVAVLFIGIYSYSQGKSSLFDGMAENSGIATSSTAVPAVDSAAAAPVVVAPVQPQGSGYSAKETTSPSELLPKDGNANWGSLNPVASSGVLMPDLLGPSYHIGINTTSQSMKNPNLQLRSEPSVQKIAGLSPWNNSSIEPDLARVPLEVGFTHV